MSASRDARMGIGATLLTASAVFLCRGAGAYEIQQTENGDDVRWYDSCLYYSVNEDGTEGIDFDLLREAVRESFDQWESVACSYFYMEETDPSSCQEIGFFQDHGNVNLLIWRNTGWEVDADHLKNAMALTTVSYNEDTGQILDADIEFNGEYFVFGVDGEETETDVRNTATHEIGHMLGLDHSIGQPSVMNPSAMPGETDKRTLTLDDEHGVCAIYPIEDDPGVCKEPFCGLDIECSTTTCANRDCDETVCSASAGSAIGASGCQVAPSRHHDPGVVPALFDLILGGLLSTE